MVPFYLMEMEANMYPVYVDNSNIDESLTNDFKIHEIRIKISDSIKRRFNQMEQNSNVADKHHESNSISKTRAKTILPNSNKKKSNLLINENDEVNNIS